MEGLEGMQKLLALMNCFRGDLPQVHGIVGKYWASISCWGHFAYPIPPPPPHPPDTFDGIPVGKTIFMYLMGYQ